MPNLTTNRRHLCSPNLTYIRASSPMLEKKTPRKVSEEDIRLSQNCSYHGCSGIVSSASIAQHIPQSECMEDMETSGDNVVVSSVSSSSFSSTSSNTTQQCQEGGEKVRKGLKRRKPSGCLVALSVGDVTPLTPTRNHTDCADVTVTPPLHDSSPPWGHYVDTILPHEDDEDRAWLTGATFSYPSTEGHRQTTSQSRGLEMQQRRSFVPSCPMPHQAASVAEHTPYPWKNVQEASAMFRQRKRHRIMTPHMLDENPKNFFRGFVLTLPVPDPAEIKMVEEAQRALKQLNVD